MHKLRKFSSGIIVSLVVFFGLLMLPRLVAHAATLTTGSLSISDSRPSTASVTYTATFSNVSNSAIKCIQMQFDTQSDGAGSAPTGMVTSGATYNAAGSDYVPDVQSWTAASSTAGLVKITNATGETAAGGTGIVVLTGITNGSIAETSYFMILTTFTDDACTGGNEVATGTVKFIYTTGQLVSLTIDPSLTFTVDAVADTETVNGEDLTITTTDGTIPFTGVTVSANGVGAHLLTVNTNAGGGYTVYTRYTAALTNVASDTITDHTGTNAQPSSFPSVGTEAFGYTTTDTTLTATGDGADRFTTPANQWAAFTTGNLEVAYSAGPVSNEETTIGYQVGVAGATEAGVYNTTIILTATPTY